MPLACRLLAALATLALTLPSALASADEPGPRRVCDVEGLGCESCWQHYDGDAALTEKYRACSEPLLAKGLVEGCRHRQGAGDQVYFCPKGKTPGTKVVGVGGGCAGCALDEDGAGAGVFAALAIGAGLLLRRRRTRDSH